MKTTKLSVIVRCVCVLHILHEVVSDVSVPGARILNGNAANPANYKFLIHIVYPLDSGMIWHCGGSVISNHYVLTVAHCLYERVCIQFELHPSDSMPDDAPEYYADECYTHENYNPNNLANDIALMRSNQNLLANRRIAKIDLPYPGTVYDVGDSAIIAGWGMIEHKQFARRLMHAIVRVIDWDQCDRIYKAAEGCANIGDCPALPDHGFCTAGDPPNPPGACLGDSGGPVIVAGYVAGLVSSIMMLNGECEVGTPSVNVKVADYIPWIGKYVAF